MPPYKEQFPVGSRVAVASAEHLQVFMRDWRFHNPLTANQLAFAGKSAVVTSVGFYHGGDVIYELDGLPGVWHEACLRDDSTTPTNTEAPDQSQTRDESTEDKALVKDFRRPRFWARVSIIVVVVALTAGGVYVGLPVWAALLIAVIAVALNGWLLKHEDRQSGGVDT